MTEQTSENGLPVYAHSTRHNLPDLVAYFDDLALSQHPALVFCALFLLHHNGLFKNDGSRSRLTNDIDLCKVPG